MSPSNEALQAIRLTAELATLTTIILLVIAAPIAWSTIDRTYVLARSLGSLGVSSRSLYIG